MDWTFVGPSYLFRQLRYPLALEYAVLVTKSHSERLSNPGVFLLLAVNEFCDFLLRPSLPWRHEMIHMLASVVVAVPLAHFAHELHLVRREHLVICAWVAQSDEACEEIVPVPSGRGDADDARSVDFDEREDDLEEEVLRNVRHLVDDDQIVGVHAPKSVNISLICCGRSL